MDSTTAWGDQSKDRASINGDRRYDRRYEMQLELKWKLIRRRKILDQGTGRTLDFSSGGILFETGRSLPAGLNVELSISWPVLLHNTAPLQLVVAGRIVRSDGVRAAIRMVQHEFRTTGAPAEHRGLIAVANRSQVGFLGQGGAQGGISKPQ
jgi:hypothetical protein